MTEDLNRRWWDERVPLHVGSDLYDVEEFKAGRDSLRPFELEELGNVTGKSLVHLQCHFGLDTLSWARRGATVTGLDFSEPAVEAARTLAAETGTAANFVAADVYDAPQALYGRTFDVVYTGLGALNWLPDLRRWAAVVASLTEPGDVLYLVEFHPLTWIYGDHDLAIEHDYFDTEPFTFEDAGSYADEAAQTTNNTTVEWQHTLASILTAVLDAGFTIELYHEHDYTLFPRWPILQERAAKEFVFPDGTPRLPLMFSLRARRT